MTSTYKLRNYNDNRDLDSIDFYRKSKKIKLWHFQDISHK